MINLYVKMVLNLFRIIKIIKLFAILKSFKLNSKILLLTIRQANN
jgi:hypothetical protein